MPSRRSFLALLVSLPCFGWLKPKAATVWLGPLKADPLQEAFAKCVFVPPVRPLMGIPYWIVKEKPVIRYVYCRTPQELATHLAETRKPPVT
jgi:hypothetical protein